MDKCVIYSRVSSVQQNFETQKEDLIKYAKLNNYEVVGIWGEKVSGFDLTVERDEYDKMKKFVVENDVKLILMWELSRLGRTTLKTLEEIAYFKKHNISIFFKKENLSTLSNDPTNKLLLGILTSMAEMERSSIVERASRGRLSSVLKGKRAGYGRLPYGFTSNDDGYLVVDEKEAQVVRDIFDMYSNGTSMRRIAMTLNSKGIPTRFTTLGKKRVMPNGDEYKILWRNNSIIAILKNKLYKGERHFKGQIVKLPQLVETETWDKVQHMLSGNYGYKARTKYVYLFKTKLFCGHCNYMFGVRTETRYANNPSFYFCNGRYDLTVRCKTGQFKSDMIDSILYKNVFNTNNTRIYQFFEDEFKNKLNVDDSNKQLVYLTGEMDVLEAKRKRINTMYKGGYISDDEFKKEQSTLRNELMDVTNSINKIERDIKNVGEVDVMSLISESEQNRNIEEQYEFVQKYVDKIMVYKIDKYDRDEYLGYSYEWAEPHKHFNNLKNDKLIYLELFAFGTKNPIKVVLSSMSKRYIVGKEDIMYNLKDKSLKLIKEW